MPTHPEKQDGVRGSLQRGGNESLAYARGQAISLLRTSRGPDTAPLLRNGLGLPLTWPMEIIKCENPMAKENRSAGADCVAGRNRCEAKS